MLNPKSNVGKLKNGVFTNLFAYFQDGRQIDWGVFIDINLCNKNKNMWSRF